MVSPLRSVSSTGKRLKAVSPSFLIRSFRLPSGNANHAFLITVSPCLCANKNALFIIPSPSSFRICPYGVRWRFAVYIFAFFLSSLTFLLTLSDSLFFTCTNVTSLSAGSLPSLNISFSTLPSISSGTGTAIK
jgi:hypothetical protein